MTAVPQQYQALIQKAATDSGLPYNVVAAQVSAESSFNPDATSPTGAEGMFQFEPSTYALYGAAGSNAYNPTQEEVAYGAYMKALLSEEGGSVDKALEAYNAGPGNLSAGASYATGILNAASEPSTLTANGGTGTTAPTTGQQDCSVTNLQGCVANAITDSFIGVLSSFGLEPSKIKGLAERGGLILMGAISVWIGMKMMGNSQSGNSSSNSSSGNGGLQMGGKNRGGGSANAAGDAGDVAGEAGEAAVTGAEGVGEIAAVPLAVVGE